MADNHLDSGMLGANQSFAPRIILDSLTIGCCAIGICKTSIIMVLIFVRCSFRRSKEKIAFLLSLNLYISVCIFTLFVLDMMVSMLKGHIHSNVSPTDNNTQWCRSKAYLTNVAMLYCLYANTFHGLYRFFRIIYYKQRFLHQNIALYVVGILIQIVLSTIQPLPLLLAGLYGYEDYHCQIPLTNWFAVIMATVLIWISPLFMTMSIYIYTVYYIRNNSTRFTLRQKTRITRDATVIKRVVWSVVFVVLCAIPAFSITIMYYLFAYFGWWGNHLAWLGFIWSFTGMSAVHTCFSPHLRPVWSQTSNRINQTTAVALVNLRQTAFGT